MEENEPPPAYPTVVQSMQQKTKNQINNQATTPIPSNASNPSQLTLHPMQRIHPGKLNLLKYYFDPEINVHIF